MTTETNATPNAEVTTEQPSAETQQVDSQSIEQADTTQQETSVDQSIAMEAPSEPENSEVSQPTIDDIVNEALSGELSEETQKLIEENGLGKHIDMLVAGHKAIQEKNHQEIFSTVGGEESYKELLEWGKHNLSQEERDAFNDGLFSGNMHLAKLAVKGLQAQYVAQNGKSPDRMIEGGASANEENRPYSDRMEYIREATSIEYKRNPEFRAKVEARRNKSGF